MAIPALPFKDFRNSWKVKVLIDNDDFVDIMHIRREQSFTSKNPEEMRFEFVWELRMRLALAAPSNPPLSSSPGSSSAASTTTDKHVQHVTLQIVEIAFGPGVPQQNKDKILGDMSKLIRPNCVVSTMPA